MEPQEIIARRIARELKPGMLVNLGIGIPTLVANYLPEGMRVFSGLTSRCSSKSLNEWWISWPRLIRNLASEGPISQK